MSKYDSMPTAAARKMLIVGAERKQIADETGLTLDSVRAIASMMRKSGVKLASAQKRYEYAGVSMVWQVVRFKSLREGLAMGFKGEHVSLCVNGHKKSYCGYVWSRVEI